MTNGFKVISSALLVSNMGANRGVSCRASQVLALTEWNVLTLAVFVALCQTEIDNVDVVFSALITSNQEIVRFDVSVDDPLLVHFLNSMDLQNTKHSEDSQSRKKS